MFNRAIMYDQPPPAPLPRALGFPDLRQEWRIAREAAHLALATPALALAPRGAGEPVMLAPGWLAPQSSMEALRRFLRRKGYHAEHWGLGVNRGAVADYVATLVPKVRARAEAAGNAVALVGWSLGGVVSREVAREAPDAVSCVVTFGSPVVGGPVYTATANRYSDEDRRQILERIRQREGRLIEVPIATIFSRIDGIVDWPACIDRLNPQVTHYEVRSTHLSMGIDPVVWRVVMDMLNEHAARA